MNELLRQTRKALEENEGQRRRCGCILARRFRNAHLGDSVYCVDPQMELPNITARIPEITEYPFDIDKHRQVTIANVMGRDMADIIANLDRSKRIAHEIMSGGQIRADVFEAFAK